MDVKKIVSQSKFAQVGFVVNDIEKAKKQFALLFGCDTDTGLWETGTGCGMRHGIF